jgi:Mg-chelatase subunit ChlD
LGRIHAGTLQPDDISDLAELFRASLGDEVFDALDVLFAEVVRIEDDDLVSLEQAARRLLDLVGGADGGGEVALSKARTAAEQALRAVSDRPVSARPLSEPPPPRTAPARHAASTPGERRENADEVDGTTTGTEATELPQIDTRPPTESEYVLRNRMTRLFRHARFREREFSDELRANPPGRVRISGLVQRDAALAEGALRSLAPVFERRRHRYVDEPILAVGLAVDTSGSMSGKERPLASALFALNGAVENAGGRVGIAAFGAAFVPIATPAAPLRGVPNLRTGGGTSYVAAAVDFVTSAAMLDRHRHNRQLYVLSDGQWNDKADVERRFAKLRDIGCSVLIVDFGSSFEVVDSAERLELSDVRGLVDALAERFEIAYRRNTW